MAEQLDVIDNFETDNMKFEIAKGYVVTARSRGKIVAIKAVTHYFHADNMLNRLRRDANYRKEFVERYTIKKPK